MKGECVRNGTVAVRDWDSKSIARRRVNGGWARKTAPSLLGALVDEFDAGAGEREHEEEQHAVHERVVADR